MNPKSILLIISGSIAAYKALELIRLLRKAEIEVDVILTKGGAQFITPLAVSSLTGRKTYTDLFSLTDEVEMGHIQLSRTHDLVLVAPASADILAKMAAGLADDLATTALLATNKPVIVAPAMNVEMWTHAATQRNIAQLKQDGIRFIEPGSGELACGEVGAGRMAEPAEIVSAILSGQSIAVRKGASLTGKKIIITAGPTYEPIDPVRFIGNHSSGKQGIAIAASLSAAGADVQLILGPSSQPVPQGITVQRVTTAQQMFEAVQASMPCDVAVCTAAVADWAPEKPLTRKLKKRDSSEAPHITLKENPDILAWLSQKATLRPELVIGFAAETEKLLENAEAKWRKKGCDWLLANEVGDDKVFNADKNEVHLFSSAAKPLRWKGTKADIAAKLTEKLVKHFDSATKKEPV